MVQHHSLVLRSTLVVLGDDTSAVYVVRGKGSGHDDSCVIHDYYVLFVVWFKLQRQWLSIGITNARVYP